MIIKMDPIDDDKIGDKEHEKLKSIAEESSNNEKKVIKNNSLEIKSKDLIIKEQAEKLVESNLKVKELDKVLNDKSLELSKEAKRNEVIQKLLNKKDEDLKRFETKNGSEIIVHRAEKAEKTLGFMEEKYEFNDKFNQ